MNNQKIKVVFLGTPEIACSVLDNLATNKNFEIQAVITQTDKPVGRKQTLTAPPVKETAKKYNLPVFQPEKLNKDEQLIEHLKSLETDFFLVFAYGQILSEQVLNIPKIKAVNIHGSILPKYRGASPIEEALLNGDDFTGISYMEMVKEMDAGSVYETFTFEIETSDTAVSLREKLSLLASETCAKTLQQIYEQKLFATPQKESEATFCHKITKEDGLIDFTKVDAVTIYNKFRAFTPWPGLKFMLKDKTVKIQHLRISAGQNLKPGEFNTENKIILVGTLKGDLEINELQMEGKQSQTAAQFLNGYQQFFQ